MTGDVVALHGTLGAPGYELLHSPNKAVKIAANKIYENERLVGRSALDAQALLERHPALKAKSRFLAWGDRAADIDEAAKLPTLRDIVDHHYSSTAPDDDFDNASEVFNHQFGAFRTEVIALDSVSKNTIMVSGRIMHTDPVTKKEVVAGRFERTIAPNEVVHNYIELKPQFQGEGFGKAFNQHMENWYIANGVKRIVLHADINVGGYAWAVQGYEFAAEDNTKSKMNNAIRRLEAIYEDRGMKPPPELAQLKKDVANGFFPSASELAMFGSKSKFYSWKSDIDTPTVSMWPGKQMMLTFDWVGVKPLIPPGEEKPKGWNEGIESANLTAALEEYHVVRLHGIKGAPGYELLHDTSTPRIAAAANKIFEEKGGGKAGQEAVARAMGPAPKPSRKGLRQADKPEDWARFGIKQSSFPGLQVNDDPDASLQAESTNLKGRKKRYYSAGHEYNQSIKKYKRIAALHEDIPKLDVKLKADALHDDTAAALFLIRQTGMRPGSEKDTKAAKKAYGATNALAKHLSISPDGKTATFVLPSKNGKTLTISTGDPDVIAMLKVRKDKLAGDERLFDISDKSALAYLKAATGKNYKVKDLRTWQASYLARQEMETITPPISKSEFLRARMQVARKVSSYLGNTPAVVIKSYLDPVLLDPWVKDGAWTITETPGAKKAAKTPMEALPAKTSTPKA